MDRRTYYFTCEGCGSDGVSYSDDIPPQGWIITRRHYGGWGIGRVQLEVMCPYCAQQRSAMRWNNVGNGMRDSSTGESSSIIKGCISWLGYLVGGLIIAVILIILF